MALSVIAIAARLRKARGAVRAAAVLMAATLVAAIAGAAGTSGAAGRGLTIVALGDSLTAGYGLPGDEAFPRQLQRALKAKGVSVNIVNAGVSGDTASGGLARLDWSVPEGTDAVILELGANDALRGTDPAVTRKALDAMLQRFMERKIPVLLCGMLAPPNLGAEYGQAFNAIYPELAAKTSSILYPFFLDGVVTNRTLVQPDGLHPTADGVAVIVRGILPQVEALIARAQGQERAQEPGAPEPRAQGR